jgi:hypothetical protein
MKSFMLLLVAMLLITFSYAKIWRVNNVPGVSADFTSAQLAHDNAQVQAGDTLHLEPSTTSYGNLTLTKRLTLISIGDFFAANPTVQYATVPGRLGVVTINNANANGSVLHCNISSSLSLTGVSNIRIERCRIESNLSLSNSSSITILNNFLYLVSIVNNSTSVIVSNNIIEYYIDMANTTSAVITNNVIKAVNTGLITSNIYNSTFQNNIINKTLTIVFAASIVQNNLTSNTTLPAGNGNQNSVAMTNVFVNPIGTDDASFRLQTASANPAAGAGVGGIDCGAYGGSTAFKPGLQAAIPAIYKINAPVTPSGSTMNVTFSTRSNN